MITEERVLRVDYLSENPVTAKAIRKLTRQDPLLSSVYRFVMEGWPESVDPNTMPYFRGRNELTVQDGCLVWGNRVIVPPSGRATVQAVLHKAHPGIVRMKTLSKNYVWWPGIGQDLERTVKECEACQ